MAEINININLPDHKEKLEKAEIYIKEQQIKLKSCVSRGQLDEKTYITLYNDILRGLDYMGSISLPLFNIQQEIEDKYVQTYRHAPELGKKLKWERIEKIHHPYDILKNRLFRLLDELPIIYEKNNRHTPPKV